VQRVALDQRNVRIGKGLGGGEESINVMRNVGKLEGWQV